MPSSALLLECSKSEKYRTPSCKLWWSVYNILELSPTITFEGKTWSFVQLDSY